MQMKSSEEKYSIEDLREIIGILRGENGCPWDKEQTHESIRKSMLEEAYEVVDAIDKKSSTLLTEELGDVLLQVVFHATLGEESNSFTWDDVTDGVCRKMIYRHPHVFGDITAETSDEVLANWEQLKTVEKGNKSLSDQMEDIAKSLPETERAFKIQKKAAKIGFDWDTYEGIIDKLKEETDEAFGAISNNENIEEEIGDVLFTAVNLARFMKVDPEEALKKSNQKFMARIKIMEQEAEKTGKTIDEMNKQELENLWKMSKKNLAIAIRENL